MNRIASNKERINPRSVAMLVNNPCVSDSRVIKSAEALAREGWLVNIICRHAAGLPEYEIINDVEYNRIKPIPTKAADFFYWLKFKIIFQIKRKIKSADGHSNTYSDDLERKGIRNKLDATEPKSELGSVSVRSNKVICKSFFFLKLALLKTLYPVKVLYWLYEHDEFKSASLRALINMPVAVVHCHDLTTLSTGLAISKINGCKVVYDSHELEMHRNANYTKAVWKKRRKIETIGIKYADTVITVSDSIADFLAVDYNIPRPHVILNSPDFSVNSEFSRSVRIDLALPKTTPLAVYVGSVTINRGLENVIKSLVDYQDLRFATVGPIRDKTKIELMALADKCRVADRVFFLPPVKPNEVVPYLRDADVSVLAIQNVCLSYYYCMPNKLLESTFAGVPVVVASLHELTKFVERYGCGVVMDEKDPASIAQAMKLVVRSREDYQIDPSVREQISRLYGWPSQAEKLCRIYDKLA